MTVAEHNNIIASIVAEEDATKRQTLLLQLTDDYKQVTAEQETLREQNTTLQTERDNYARLNNELWVRNNTQKLTGVKDEPDTVDEPPAKLNFEDLTFE